MDSVPGMARSEAEARDCSQCRSAGSVYGSICQVCFQEFDESPGSARRPLRFSDVLDEIRSVADLASTGTSSVVVAEACVRLQDLLIRLRCQFLVDVVSSGMISSARR